MSANFVRDMVRYSAALCRGLIEARNTARCGFLRASGIPRLYAAASLKPAEGQTVPSIERTYSAALCRGLIEATRDVRYR